jgi:hypothetical protein
MSRMSAYEERIRERFPALVADPIWPAIHKLVKEDWRDDEDYWWPGIQQHCIDLSKRLGLSFGPARCCGCDALWVGAGDVPDGQSPGGMECPACLAYDAEEAKRKDAHREWYESLSPEDRKTYDDAGRVSLLGLIKRDVQ